MHARTHTRIKQSTDSGQTQAKRLPGLRYSCTVSMTPGTCWQLPAHAAPKAPAHTNFGVSRKLGLYKQLLEEALQLYDEHGPLQALAAPLKC